MPSIPSSSTSSDYESEEGEIDEKTQALVRDNFFGLNENDNENSMNIDIPKVCNYFFLKFLYYRILF